MAAPEVAPPKVETEEQVRETLAPLYRVICHDDPVTTMDFVVEVLTAIFRLSQPRAIEVMLDVHNKGAALVGCYPRSLAERRVNRAKSKARAQGFPLTFSVEPDD